MTARRADPVSPVIPFYYTTGAFADLGYGTPGFVREPDDDAVEVTLLVAFLEESLGSPAKVFPRISSSWPPRSLLPRAGFRTPARRILR